MKRSQMEIMGIAIVVVLLSLALLFVLRFVITRDPANPSKEYMQSEYAANFLNTLLETTAPDCSNVEFKTLYMDCANHPDIGGNIPCARGFTACEYIDEKTRALLSETLEEWGNKYYFIATTDSPDSVFGGSQYIFEPINNSCEDYMERKGKIQPLPSDPEINVGLFLCG